MQMFAGLLPVNAASCYMLKLTGSTHENTSCNTTSGHLDKVKDARRDSDWEVTSSFCHGGRGLHGAAVYQLFTNI